MLKSVGLGEKSLAENGHIGDYQPMSGCDAFQPFHQLGVACSKGEDNDEFLHSRLDFRQLMYAVAAENLVPHEFIGGKDSPAGYVIFLKNFQHLKAAVAHAVDKNR